MYKIEINGIETEVNEIVFRHVADPLSPKVAQIQASAINKDGAHDICIPFEYYETWSDEEILTAFNKFVESKKI